MTKEKKPETELAAIPKQALSGQLMYVGPSLSNPIHLQHRAVFANGLPTNVQKLVEADAELASCFLPLAEAGKALRELDNMSSALGQGIYVKRYNSILKRYKENNS